MAEKVELMPVVTVAKAVVPERDDVVRQYLAASGATFDAEIFRIETIKALEMLLGDRGKLRKHHWNDMVKQDLRLAITRCAKDGLFPGEHVGISAVWSKALGRFEIKLFSQYPGALQILARAGVETRPPKIVYEGDLWEEGEGINASGEPYSWFKHEPVRELDARGEPQRVYVTYRRKSMDGTWKSDVLVLDRDYIENVRKQAISRGDNAWTGPFPLEMWKKTAIKRLPKHLQLKMPGKSFEDEDAPMSLESVPDVAAVGESQPHIMVETRPEVIQVEAPKAKAAPKKRGGGTPKKASQPKSAKPTAKASTGSATQTAPTTATPAATPATQTQSPTAKAKPKAAATGASTPTGATTPSSSPPSSPAPAEQPAKKSGMRPLW